MADNEAMTVGRSRRPLIAGAFAGVGVLLGGLLGFFGGWWLSSLSSGSPDSESVFTQFAEGLVGAVPYLWLGTLVGAALGWLIAPPLIGSLRAWPKVWSALGVQVVAGIALWLALAFIASTLDIGAIGAWTFVFLVIIGPPAAGRWLADRGRPEGIQTRDVQQSDLDPD